MPNMNHPIVYAPERRIRGDIKVLSYDSVDLFASDQYSLRRRGWLTDAVVTFAAQFLRDELISDDKRNMVEVLAAAVTECIKFINPMEQAVQDIGLSSKRYNFFLVNDNMNPSMIGGGTHWSLLVYDPRRRGFVFLDSRPSVVDSTLQLLADNIAAAMGLEHLPIEMPPCPKMDINGDCGVYLIEFIKGIFKQLNEENFENPYIFEQLSQDDINRSRKYWFCKIAELGSKVSEIN
uniref:ULP_PROTEASE domain-containing protein n=1 Tax=Panagrellus redivivus TaxID=6233 RepID=A0A7E4WAR4_PANRE